MARKRRRPAIDYAVYLGVRLVIGAIQAVPMAFALKLAAALGWLLHCLDKRHRVVASENLCRAFPELADDPAALNRLVRATYRHFATVAIEVALLPRKMHVAAWRRFSTMYPGTGCIRPMFSPRPNLIVTAHFGNWEMAGWIIGLFGQRSYAIARVLDNPYLERFVKWFRQSTGQTIIAKKDDYERLTEALRSGGKVATLADQDAGQRGVFVEFFGRPASTHKAVALMAIEFDAPITVIGVPRVAEPMFYAVECEEVIEPRDYADRPDAVKAITQRYTAALERMIRRHPEQYFWMHRRWKHQPVERSKPRRQAA
jgi:KDO2-lipid IV(A) lauroyltransferase